MCGGDAACFQSGEIVPLDHYQRFMNALKRMCMEIFTLRRDIEDTLYALDPLTNVAGASGCSASCANDKALYRQTPMDAIGASFGASRWATAPPSRSSAA